MGSLDVSQSYRLPQPVTGVALVTLQSELITQRFVRFEVPTAVVMDVAKFWDVVPCSPYVNQHCGRIYH
jgi:hypothetical protein